MIVIALLWIVFSPLFPMIYLFTRYYATGSNRLVISLVMFAVCALICFLGNLYENHAHGFERMRSFGAIWGGYAGMIVAVIMLIIAVFK